FIGGLVVVANTVVERQFAVDLPRVLYEEPKVVLTPLAILKIGNATCVRGAEQEAGVGETDRVPTDRGRVHVGLPCLGGVKGVVTIGATRAHAGPDIHRPLSAGPIAVIAPDPGATAHHGGLVV